MIRLKSSLLRLEKYRENHNKAQLGPIILITPPLINPIWITHSKMDFSRDIPLLLHSKSLHITALI